MRILRNQGGVRSLVTSFSQHFLQLGFFLLFRLISKGCVMKYHPHRRMLHFFLKPPPFLSEAPEVYQQVISFKSLVHRCLSQIHQWHWNLLEGWHFGNFGSEFPNMSLEKEKTKPSFGSRVEKTITQDV